MEGLLVIDLTRILAGPWCTRRLNDLGARIVKVEKPPGGANERGDRFAHAGYNYGKESIALDWMNDEGDRRVFYQLLDEADVLIENFRAGTMKGTGLGWGGGCAAECPSARPSQRANDY